MVDTNYDDVLVYVGVNKILMENLYKKETVKIRGSNSKVYN